ncbi:MAG: hypothetical protein LBM00_09675 [Deltaproteobacteria bacterium]|jgi:hypothetical protein|nr:hypothetical protein [Deltaproteobacteria bacterium]
MERDSVKNTAVRAEQETPILWRGNFCEGKKKIMKHRSLWLYLSLIILALFPAVKNFSLNRPADLAVKIVADITILHQPGGKSLRYAALFLSDYIRIESPVLVGKKVSVEFPISVASVRHLRLDVIDEYLSESGIDIELYAVTLKYGNKTLARFTPKDLSKWFLHDLVLVEVKDDHILVRTTGSDPIMRQSFNPPLPVSWSEIVLSKVEQVPLGVVFTVFVLIALLLSPSGRRGLALLAVGCLATFLLVYVLHGLGARPFPVDKAVGYAAYHNKGQAAYLWFYLLAFTAPMLVAASAWFLRKRLNGAAAWEIHPDRSRLSMGLQEKIRALLESRPVEHLLLVCMVLCILIVNLPPLTPYPEFSLPPFQAHWDYNNLLAWRAFLAEGMLPYRDFWYPYAGLSFFELPYPWNSFARSIINTALYLVLFFSLHELTQKRVWKTVCVFAALIVLMLSDPSPIRYIVPILCVICSYASIDNSKSSPQGGHLLFTAAVALNLLLEPLNLFRVGLPIAALLVVEVCANPDRRTVTQLRALCRIFLPPLLVLAVLCGILQQQGLLANVFDFYAGLGGVSAYADWGPQVDRWFMLRAPYYGPAYWLAALTAGIGVWQRLYCQDKSAIPVVAILIGGMMLIFGYKVMVRTDDPMISGMYLFSGAAAIIWIFLIKDNNSALKPVQYAALVCLIAAALPHMRDKANDILFQIRGISQIYPWATMAAEQQRRLTESLYYNDDKFAAYPDQLAFAPVLRNFVEPGDLLYILGDDPVLYILSHTKPAFHVNTYDASPLHEQQKIVSILEREKPVLVWTGYSMTVDGLPLSVRDPVLLAGVVTRYAPEKRAGKYVICRPLQDGEKPALGFWSGELGNEIRLKAIPGRSNAHKLPAVSKTAAGAAEVLTLEAGDVFAGAHEPLAVSVSISGITYTVTADLIPGRSSYPIILDRLWFVAAARNMGIKDITVTWPDTVKGERVWRDISDVLY